MRYAGYNMIVTSEINMKPIDVYNTYHSLCKIEESFKISKSMLDARPVYLQKKETIYGHFLICYLSLFLLRVLEIKCLENKVNSYDIIISSEISVLLIKVMVHSLTFLTISLLMKNTGCYWTY